MACSKMTSSMFVVATLLFVNLLTASAQTSAEGMNFQYNVIFVCGNGEHVPQLILSNFMGLITEVGRKKEPQYT